MITSTSNDRVKKVVMLQEKNKARIKEHAFVAEGIKMFEEAPIERIRELYIEEGLYRRLKEETEKETKSPAAKKLEVCEGKLLLEIVSKEAFSKMSDTKAPQGILLVMERYDYSQEEMVAAALKKQQETGKAPLFLLLEDIQDPGNLGTMLRTGEGAGIDGVIMTKDTVDIYNPKTIRSTMGSLYRMPFFYTEDMEETIAMLQRGQIEVYAAHLKGRQYYDEMSFEKGSAFLIGNEGNGLKKETADLADSYLKIPMEGKLESLNAAVAAALLMYRAAAFRRKA